MNRAIITEDHVYMASGVVLYGGVRIKKLIGDGVVLALGRTIGKECIVTDGATVKINIEDNFVA